MVKLPDGRTRYVNLIGGEASVLQREFDLAMSLSESNRSSEGLEHFQKVINLYETGKMISKENGVSGVSVPDTYAGNIYYNAAAGAEHVGLETGRREYFELAYEYATNAVALTNTPLNLSIVAGAAAILGKWDVATNSIQQALDAEPNSPLFIKLKREIFETHGMKP
jgi:tetratricopeptide (TPR) repeat protein